MGAGSPVDERCLIPGFGGGAPVAPVKGCTVEQILPGSAGRSGEKRPEENEIGNPSRGQVFGPCIVDTVSRSACPKNSRFPFMQGQEFSVRNAVFGARTFE